MSTSISITIKDWITEIEDLSVEGLVVPKKKQLEGFLENLFYNIDNETLLNKKDQALAVMYSLAVEKKYDLEDAIFEFRYIIEKHSTRDLILNTRVQYAKKYDTCGVQDFLESGDIQDEDLQCELTNAFDKMDIYDIFTAVSGDYSSWDESGPRDQIFDALMKN